MKEGKKAYCKFLHKCDANMVITKTQYIITQKLKTIFNISDI